MPALIRNAAHILIGVLLLGTVMAIGNATASSATGTPPTVTAIFPNNGPTTGGTAITIDGTGFLTGATVVIGQGNGTTGAIAARNVDVVSSTQITAVTGGGAMAGAFSLFVTTSGGTNVGTVKFYYELPSPTVSNVSPNSGPTSGGTPITVTGTGFAAGASVEIGQGNGTTGAIAATNVVVVSSTEITATPGGPALPGTFSLYVTTSGGTSTGNSRADFTYSNSVVPTVSGVSPNNGPTTGGTAITIDGTGFVTGASVEIGQGNSTGAIAATNVDVVSSTEITATTGGPALPGTFSLFVTTSGGMSAGNSGANFTYSPAGVAPTVTKVSPNSGGIDGATAVTITGTGFTSPATVVIGQGNGTTGAIAATNVVVVSSTEITATVGGAAKPGTWSLYVTTSGGTSTPNAGADFTYFYVGDATPVIHSISPNSGPTTGGTVITISGDFPGVNGVTPRVLIGQGNGTIGAIPATNLVQNGDTFITVTTGGGAKAGTFNLYVITGGGTSAANSQSRFTYN